MDSNFTIKRSGHTKFKNRFTLTNMLAKQSVSVDFLYEFVVDLLNFKIKFVDYYINIVYYVLLFC